MQQSDAEYAALLAAQCPRPWDGLPEEVEAPEDARGVEADPERWFGWRA
jgi:hypothetical protein